MKKILLIITLVFCIFQMVVLATAIDIGVDFDYEGSYSIGARTIISLVNPANASGTITSVTIHNVGYDMVDCEVATFFLVSGNNYSTRDTEYIGAVSGEQQFNVNLDVVAGDFIGLYNTSVLGRTSTKTGGSYKYLASDQIPCTDVTFSNVSNTACIYGIGATAPTFPIAKFGGVEITVWNTKEITVWNTIE